MPSDEERVHDAERAETPEQEQEALRRIEVQRARLRDLLAMPLPVRAGDRSPLGGDDRAGSIYPISHVANGALACSIDHLQTLEALLAAGALPMVGAYPIMRATIESSMTVVYLLGNANRDERLSRLVHVLAADAQDQKHLGIVPAETVEHRAAQQIVEARPGVHVRRERLTYSEIVRTADREIDLAGSMLMAWNLLSGLSHGKRWAMHSLLDRDQVQVDDADSLTIRLTSSATNIEIFLGSAVVATIKARQLLERSAASP